MANLGDKLRSEFTLPDWFEETVVANLRGCGRCSFVCNQTCVDRDGFTSSYVPALTKWADDNGVNYHFRYTCNGKFKVIEFML